MTTVSNPQTAAIAQNEATVNPEKVADLCAQNETALNASSEQVVDLCAQMVAHLTAENQDDLLCPVDKSWPVGLTDAVLEHYAIREAAMLWALRMPTAGSPRSK